MHKWLSLLAAVALLALALAGGFWFHRHYKYVRETSVGPPQGPAAYDPFYAAAHALEGYGEQVVLQPFLNLTGQPPAPGDIIVYYGDVRHLGAAEIAALKKWLSTGGQFVVQVPSEGDRMGALLESFGLKFSHSKKPRCPDVVLARGEAPQRLDICEGRRFTSPDGNDGLLFLGLGVGKGELTVVSSLDFMTNSSLQKPCNARYMLRVLAPNFDHGRIFLIYSIDVAPWPMLLFRRAWPVLVALALLTLAWLLSISRRFGPIRAAAPPARRALLEHVRAGAELLWREGEYAVLYRAVKETLQRRLRRRRPAVAVLPGDERLRQLAEIGGLPEDRVRAALSAREADLGRHLHEYIITLLHIRKRL